MFLNQLDSTEKLALLTLAEQAASANGLLEDEERQIIEAFRIEMGVGTSETIPDNVDAALSLLAKGSERCRRIAYLELIALLKGGEGFDEDEREFATRLQTELGVDADTAQRIESQLDDYEFVYASLCQTVLV